MLTEVKTESEHFFEDKDGNIHGEYKFWYANGQLGELEYFHHGELHGVGKHWFETGDVREHNIYKFGVKHGEYRTWDIHGDMLMHLFFQNGENISDEIGKELKDILNPTDDERLLIKLKWGIDLC